MRLSGEHVIEAESWERRARAGTCGPRARADHVWPHAEEALAVEPDVAIVGISAPAMQWNSVVLPEPFGPISRRSLRPRP